MSRRRAVFALAAATGLALRLWLVFATEGTPDVAHWAGHAKGLDTLGFGYDRTSWLVNHPPSALLAVHALWRFAGSSGVPFRIVLRLPMLLADVASVRLLLRGLGDAALGRKAAAAFWLGPLAIVLSSHHGNTDDRVVAGALTRPASLTRWIARGDRRESVRRA